MLWSAYSLIITISKYYILNFRSPFSPIEIVLEHLQGKYACTLLGEDAQDAQIIDRKALGYVTSVL